MGIEIDVIEIGKKGDHLGRGQLLPGSYHAVTGDEEKEGIESIFDAAADPEFAKIAGKIVEELGKVIPPRQKLRYRLKGKGTGTEGFELKAETAERLQVFTEQGRLLEVELDNLREEQPLPGHRAAMKLPAQALKADPFMGGMLIDEKEMFIILGDNITGAKLADDYAMKRNKSRQRVRRPLAAREEPLVH